MRGPMVLIPPSLVLLALYDLRVDLLLLWDHFTWSALLAAVVSHPLAVAVLILTPHLMRRP